MLMLMLFVEIQHKCYMITLEIVVKHLYSVLCPGCAKVEICAQLHVADESVYKGRLLIMELQQSVKITFLLEIQSIHLDILSPSSSDNNTAACCRPNELRVKMDLF